MKILLLSTADISGGAPKAAHRLHAAYNSLGHESVMYVAKKVSNDQSVISTNSKFWKFIYKILSRIDNFPLRFYRKRSAVFSVNWFPDSILKTISQVKPDVVHFHWVGHGFVNIKTVGRINCPVVWTLHDMWPFTGGCHYSNGCEKYQNECGACPQLNSVNPTDITRKIIHRKTANNNFGNIVVVSPSEWLANCARSSTVFKNNKVLTIPYNIDTNVYKPVEKQMARTLLNLPQNKKIVLFGAMSATSDPRKGFPFLEAALTQFSDSENSEIDLMIFGSEKPLHPLSLKNKTHYAGVLSDDKSLALCYAAADVFVAPSTEDNLPLTVMESLACGTPVVAFDIGGMRDMISHQSNGYLAPPFDATELKNGIVWTLSNAGSLDLRNNARNKVLKEYNSEKIVSSYMDIYRKLLGIS